MKNSLFVFSHGHEIRWNVLWLTSSLTEHLWDYNSIPLTKMWCVLNILKPLKAQSGYFSRKKPQKTTAQEAWLKKNIYQIEKFKNTARTYTQRKQEREKPSLLYSFQAVASVTAEGSLSRGPYTHSISSESRARPLCGGGSAGDSSEKSKQLVWRGVCPQTEEWFLEEVVEVTCCCCLGSGPVRKLTTQCQ